MKCEKCLYELKVRDIKIPKYFRGKRICANCWERLKWKEQRQEWLKEIGEE